MFVNDRWCNPGHTTIKEQICNRDIELLAVSMRPHYLPREFTHVIAIAVYIPPSKKKAEEACGVISSTVSRLQTQHPNALLLISGDFNQASLSKTLPTFKQHVTCTTRGNTTLDLPLYRSPVPNRLILLSMERLLLATPLGWSMELKLFSLAGFTTRTLRYTYSSTPLF